MRLALVVAAAAALLASVPSNAVAQKKQRDVITNEEIMKSGSKDGDLLTAIKVLRPQFFEPPKGVRSIGGTFQAPILVVVDGRRGDADMLISIKAVEAKEIRYLDPNKSQNEYGINHNSGAIVVKLMSAKDIEKANAKP
jgi:hypothetical protein